MNYILNLKTLNFKKPVQVPDTLKRPPVTHFVLVRPIEAHSARPNLDLHIYLPEAEHLLEDRSTLLLENFRFSHKSYPESNSENLI